MAPHNSAIQFPSKIMFVTRSRSQQSLASSQHRYVASPTGGGYGKRPVPAPRTLIADSSGVGVGLGGSRHSLFSNLDKLILR